MVGNATTVASGWDRVFEGIGNLFYIVHPNKAVEHHEDVPDYVARSSLFFILFIVLEVLVFVVQKRKHLIRVNSSFSNVAAGTIQQIVSKLFCMGFELSMYVWVYNRIHFIDLRWDSAWTWWIAFFAVDFGYYWFHRGAHEINIFWAAHVVHHSSEDYNLTAALRQSLLQQFTSWIFYLPAAIAIPPSIMYLHRQFNTLYQFWIHTQVIGKLGPLEYILNTPSHHRVHHGRNRYCIDKNYAATLIIWDRLFGTFEAEDEEVVYGITHPLNTWDPVFAQFHHVIDVFRKAWSMPGLVNKFKCFFYGPGWHPGTGRTGSLDEIPDAKAGWPVFDTKLPFWLSIYIVVHFLVLLAFYTLISDPRLGANFPETMMRGIGIYIIISLTSFGALFDHKSYAYFFEMARLATFLLLEIYFWYQLEEKFVFLWYENASVPAKAHSALKVVRSFYSCSAIWLTGRYLFMDLFGTNEKLKKL